jgi:NADH-quinone oxidoreductase subunit M
MFWAMVVACGITGAIFPFHLWYPAAHRHMPVATQALIGSLLLNMGGYGLIRVCLLVFPLAAASFGPAILAVSTAGIVYASLAALGCQRLPNALAYWNVAQAGFVVIGIFSLHNLGLHGAVMSMAANSLAATALLFMSMDGSGGSDRLRRKDRHQWSVAARWLGLLSAAGTPGLIGFLGKGLLVMGVARWRWQLRSPAASSAMTWGWYALVLLAALLATWALVRAVLQTPLPGTQRQRSDRVLLALPLLIVIVVVGLRPSLATDITGPSTHRLLYEVSLGVERGLLQMAPPATPDEIEKPLPTTPDEGPTASNVPAGLQGHATTKLVGHALDGR